MGLHEFIVWYSYAVLDTSLNTWNFICFAVQQNLKYCHSRVLAYRVVTKCNDKVFLCDVSVFLFTKNNASL
jgi:hypothetical protein